MDSLLETLHERNSAFTPELPGLQIAWDSTSLGLLKECPRKYLIQNVLGYVSPRAKTALTFGLAYHAGLESFDIALAKGADRRTALHSAIRRALSLVADFESDDTRRTKETLIRSIIWYVDHFENDPCTTKIRADGVPMVELTFKYDSGVTIAGQSILFTGHLDRVVEFNGQTWISDRKTTGTTLSSRYFDNFSPDNQMSMYTLAGQMIFSEPASGIVIDAAQLAVNFTRFGRGFAPRTKKQVVEWYEEAVLWLHLAAQFAKARHWPANDKSCGNYGGCPFRTVCSKDPSVRLSYLEGDFAKQIWNPLENRS